MRKKISSRILSMVMALTMVMVFQVSPIDSFAAGPQNCYILDPVADMPYMYQTDFALTIETDTTASKVDYYLDDATTPFYTDSAAANTYATYKRFSKTIARDTAKDLLPVGDHILKAVASNASGETSAPILRNLSITKAAINNILSAGAALYNNYVFNLSYTCTSISPDTVKKAELYMDGNLTATQTTGFSPSVNATSGIFSLDLSSYATGNHTLQIKSYTSTTGTTPLAVSAVRSLSILDSAHLLTVSLADQSVDTTLGSLDLTSTNLTGISALAPKALGDNFSIYSSTNISTVKTVDVSTLTPDGTVPAGVSGNALEVASVAASKPAFTMGVNKGRYTTARAAATDGQIAVIESEANILISEYANLSENMFYMLYQTGTNSTVGVKALIFDRGGLLKATKPSYTNGYATGAMGGSGIKYAANKWYKVKTRMDVQTGIVDVSVSGDFKDTAGADVTYTNYKVLNSYQMYPLYNMTNAGLNFDDLFASAIDLGNYNVNVSPKFYINNYKTTAYVKQQAQLPPTYSGTIASQRYSDVLNATLICSNPSAEDITGNVFIETKDASDTITRTSSQEVIFSAGCVNDARNFTSAITPGETGTLSFVVGGQSAYTCSVATKALIDNGGYVMPDKYNTGYQGKFEDLQEIDQKYPQLNREASGRIKITQPGMVLENFKVTGGGFIYIEADDVTLRNFYIDGSLSDTSGVDRGIDNRTSTGLLVEDGEIVGTNTGAVATGTGSTILRRLHIHDVFADGIKLSCNTTVESCYIHNCGKTNPLAHADGMQLTGNPDMTYGNIQILGNRIDMPHLPYAYTVTSTMMLKPDLGNLDNVEVRYNWLNGGQYSAYICDTENYRFTNTVFANNKFGSGAVWGFTNFSCADPTEVENNQPIDGFNVGSIVFKDAAGDLVTNLSEAGTSVRCVADLANYTATAQNGVLVAELYKDGILQNTVTDNFTIDRYVHFNEYSLNNLGTEVIDGTTLSYLITQPAPEPTDIEKEVTISLPTELSGYEVKAYVLDDPDSAVALRSETIAVGGDPITALSINTPANLSQTYGDTDAVDFSVEATPSTNINTTTIAWYVNDVKQADKGLTFRYTPQYAGSYTVIAKVGDDVESEARTILVDKATPQITAWPTVKSAIYSGSTFGSALNADGTASVAGAFSIEDHDTMPAVHEQGYSKYLIFTPTDSANYNSVTSPSSVVIVVQEPAGLMINTPSNLIQSGTYTVVDFSVITSSGIADEDIEWYINETKQPQTGKSFSYMPTGIGRYNVYAKVGEIDTQSETRTIVIDGATAENISITSMTLSPVSLSLWADFPAPVKAAATILPAGATNTVLRWESNNPTIATVDAVTGNITTVAPGTALIVAKSTDGSNITSSAFTLNVTEARNRPINQKMNLDPTSTARVNVNQYLSWPQNVGEAQIALWSGNTTGAFSMTVDDSISGDFAQWKQWTQSYGYPFTFFVPTGSTWVPAQLNNWQGLIDAGEEIQSHTYSHVSNTDAAKLTSAQTIQEYQQPLGVINGLNGGKAKTIGFSYGYSDLNYSRQFYIAGRGTVGVLNQAATVNYNTISSLSMSGATALTYQVANSCTMEGAVKALYDTNYKVWNTNYYGGWTNLHSHSLTTPQTNVDLGAGTTGKMVFEALFNNYLKPAQDAGKVWVDNFTNVAMYGQERDTAQVVITANTDNAIKFAITDQMDDTMFDFPLTVKLKVDSSWNGISATQNGVSIPIATVADNGSKYVLVKAVPDKGEVAVVPTINTAPAVTAEDTANTIAGLNLDTMEYAISIDGGVIYGNYTSDPLPSLGGSKVVKVRLKAQGQTPAGADTILTFTPNAGDVSGDGIIDISDVVMAAEIAVGSTSYSAGQIARANVSEKNNAVVDIADVVLISERAVGGTATFPVDLP